MSSAIVYPNGDGTKTGFSNQSSGTTNLYSVISEGTASPNDTNWVMNTDPIDKSVFFLLTDMPGDFVTAANVVISLRLRRELSKANVCSWISCQVVQADETTALTDVAAITDTTSILTYTFAPAIVGAKTKTAWDGARLKLSMSNGGLNGGLVYLYAAQVTVNYNMSTTKLLARRRRMMLGV